MGMLKKEFISVSAEATKELAEKFGKRLWEGSCLLLSGDLGAGKTCFTQGLGQGLNIKRKISSPTFTLLKVYQEGRLVLYHLDAYRLENAFQDVGFSEFIALLGVSVIEWPEYLEPLLPKEYLKIDFGLIAEDKRLLKLEAVGDAYCALLQEVLC